MQPLLKKSMAEFIGTFALVFAGCGSIMVAERFQNSIPLFVIAPIFGLAVATMIYAVGHISGAHFNPAVTLAFAVSKHFPKREILAYWIAQFTGALVAVFLLWVILPSGVHFGETLPTVSVLSALTIEAILSFFLMFVIIAVATDTRAQGAMAGIAIGGTVMFCAWLGGPVTGASMNPARSLAPALFARDFSSLWIYFLGPAMGMILAGIVYNFIRCEESSKSSKGCC